MNEKGKVPAIIIMQMVKTRSLSVSAATLPNPTYEKDKENIRFFIKYMQFYVPCHRRSIRGHATPDFAYKLKYYVNGYEWDAWLPK